MKKTFALLAAFLLLAATQKGIEKPKEIMKIKSQSKATALAYDSLANCFEDLLCKFNQTP